MGPPFVLMWLSEPRRETLVASDASTSLTHPQRAVGAGCVVQTHVKGLNP